MTQVMFSNNTFIPAILNHHEKSAKVPNQKITKVPNLHGFKVSQKDITTDGNPPDNNPFKVMVKSLQTIEFSEKCQ